MDESHLDDKYFIDRYVYNCPYCKRHNVSYRIKHTYSFDWSNEKECTAIFVECSSCDNKSMHLTFNFDEIAYDAGTVWFREDVDIDNGIFYSRPTSFFTMDISIPREIRDLISEAEESLQFSLLTGASATLRKSIYKLLKREDCIVTNSKTNRTDYKSSIEGLRDKFMFVDSDLFDTLSTIQGLASNPVHEDEWETWDNKTVRFLIELTKSILNEMYAVPQKRLARKKQLEELKEKLNPSRKTDKNTANPTDTPSTNLQI